MVTLKTGLSAVNNGAFVALTGILPHGTGGKVWDGPSTGSHRMV